ncbi:MAG: hypothetical protein QF615_09785, partial [Planctomycetota bacterium]|nr:hypothetical protein [Planctomycetota bacterium]
MLVALLVFTGLTFPSGGFQLAGLAHLKGPTQDCAPHGPGGSPPAALETLTPNSFLAQGTPTFIVGTAGDDRADRQIRAQARFMRDLLFPEAEIVDDTAFDPRDGPAAWPAHPVVYGGAHVNRLIAALAEDLPFSVEAGRLRLGGHEVRGQGAALLAAIPAREPAAASGATGGAAVGATGGTSEDIAGASPSWPAFLLYAGTGTPGVVDINGISHGRDAYLVADTWGPLAAGGWHREANGRLHAVERISYRRIPWREHRRGLFGRDAAGETTGWAATIGVLWPEMIPARADEGAVTDTVLGALEHVVRRLAITNPAPVGVHIHPDQRSKLSLTTVGGDGHALAGLGAVHVLDFPAGKDGPLDSLLRHEGTHALVAQAWGPAGSPAWGEGLAVWVAGAYGGRPLADWRGSGAGQPPPSLVEFLGRGFFDLPERESYPLAGALVAAVVEELGLEVLREHLYG